MKAVIEIDMDNDAFQDGNMVSEFFRILNSVAGIIRRSGIEFEDGDIWPLRDANGNRVGELTITQE